MTSKPSLTNSPKLARQKEGRVLEVVSLLKKRERIPENPELPEYREESAVQICQRYYGGYSVGVPPLPIPNREVKPVCADGTAMQCGRVGDRPFSVSPCCQYNNKDSFFVFVELNR